MGAAAICCTVYFLFTALCGLNYYRYTFTQHTGYDVEEADVDAAQRQEELVALTATLADELGQARAQLGDDANLFDAEPGQFEPVSYTHLSGRSRDLAGLITWFG